MRLLLPPLIHGGRKVGARGCWGEGGGSRNRKLVFNENRVSVLQDEKSFGELWCNKVNVLTPTENG